MSVTREVGVMKKSLPLFMAIALVAVLYWYSGKQSDESLEESRPAILSEPVVPVVQTQTESTALPPLTKNLPLATQPVADSSENISVVAAQSVEIDEVSEPIVKAPNALAGSDSRVFIAVQDLKPELAQWLVDRELVRKIVLMVDLMAQGDIPVKHRPLDYAMDQFRVVQRGQSYEVDPKNYERTIPLVFALTAISPQRLADYYRGWYPLLERAYAEQGRNDHFDNRVHMAIDNILQAPPAPQGALLKQPRVLYQYADPELEQASHLHKWLWRLGPENQQRIQQFLQSFKQYLLAE